MGTTMKLCSLLILTLIGVATANYLLIDVKEDKSNGKFCPENCELCRAGPCDRWCSQSNWCGDSDEHINGGTNCTGCTDCAKKSWQCNYLGMTGLPNCCQGLYCSKDFNEPFQNGWKGTCKKDIRPAASRKCHWEECEALGMCCGPADGC